jgi:alpha-amylase/alpha-mannosidase (GH57 family)
MSSLLWANLINMYQPPNCDRAELESIVNKSYLPLFKFFAQSPEYKLTLNIPACTVELLIKTGFGQIIKKIASLADAGQIDFTATPRYQPLIPLQSEEDIDRQIEVNSKICKRYFGINYSPKGFYSPNLGYSPKASKAAARFGLKWVAIDEISIQAKPQNAYQSLFMDKSAGGIILMPKHRDLSDQLEGSIWAKKVPKAASEFVQSAIQMCANDKYFITVTEAESFGYRQPGRHGFLKALYGERKLKPTTVSELRLFIKRKEFVKAVEGSIETQPYNMKKKKPFQVWENDNNPLQQTLWQLFNLASAEIKNAGAKGDAQFIRAREMFDASSAAINWLSASCNPYWNGAYPLQVADDLSIAVFVLMSSPLKAKEAAIALRQKIYDIVEQFEKSGEVKKLQRNFLRVNNIPFERFLGRQGEKESQT